MTKHKLTYGCSLRNLLKIYKNIHSYKDLLMKVIRALLLQPKPENSTNVH